ncbi:MAG: cell division protein FtsA, partial [Patescibacteria group bacterium]
KEVFGEWLGFFERAGFAVTFFDVEILAAFRAIFKQRPSEPVCIVDIGAAFTVIAIFNSEGLQYIYSLKTAGNIMTAAIADAFGISEKEAEDRKISMGMLGQEGKLFSVLEKSFWPVIESIRTSLTGFQERFGREPNEIVLIGGGSEVNGLVPYIQAQFTRSVRKGTSFIQEGDHMPLRYIEAIGLALRGLEREEDQKDPVMLSKTALSTSIPTVLAVHGEKRLEKKEEKMIPLEAVMATPHEIVTIRKFRFEKKVLIMILVAGVGLILLAWWFREYERAWWNRRFPRDVGLTQESVSPGQAQKTLQSFSVKVPVALDEAGNNREAIQARMVTDIIVAVKGDGEEETIARSLVKVRSRLTREETVWVAPLFAVSEKKPVKTGSRTFQWLVYNEKQADDFLVREAERVGNLYDYSLRGIEKLALAPTDNPLLFYLTGKVTVFADVVVRESQ